jgi:ADP-dependent phosphofructokinase/glucokinase
MFENVINYDAINALTQEELDKLLEMLEKAGY